MRVDAYELSHLILRFEQEKDMKPMHCVQNLGALRDLVDLRIEHAGCERELSALREKLTELEHRSGDDSSWAEVMTRNCNRLTAQLKESAEREAKLRAAFAEIKTRIVRMYGGMGPGSAIWGATQYDKGLCGGLQAALGEIRDVEALLTANPTPQEKCTHERLNEDGQCRSCGADKRGIGI